jgi:hypothetical protein
LEKYTEEVKGEISRSKNEFIDHIERKKAKVREWR